MTVRQLPAHMYMIERCRKLMQKHLDGYQVANQLGISVREADELMNFIRKAHKSS